MQGNLVHSDRFRSDQTLALVGVQATRACHGGPRRDRACERDEDCPGSLCAYLQIANNEDPGRYSHLITTFDRSCANEKSGWPNWKAPRLTPV